MLSTLGHLTLAARLANRSYRLGLPKVLWLGLLMGLAAAVVAIPWTLVAFCGLPLPWGIRPVTWPLRSALWVAYAALCIGALVHSISLALQRWRAPNIQHHLVVSRKALLFTPSPAMGQAAVERPRWLAYLPFNEIHRAELVERALFLPRLPPAWDGLAILHISDLHLNGTPGRVFFEDICAAAAQLPIDMVLLTGDIADTPHFLAWLPSTIGRLTGPCGRFFVHGNHDMRHARASSAAMAQLGFVHLGSRWMLHNVRGHSLLLCGTERPWVRAHPDLSAAPKTDFRVLVSHTPDCLPWAQRHDIDLMVAGHLHGGQVRLPLVGAWHAGHYPGGVFFAEPTLLHVSRGLGQRTPLRWRCRPEITRLILRRPSRTTD
jgi:hypothetical protein